MTRLASIAAIASLAIIGPPALAENQDRPAERSEEGGRYSFHRAGDRFVRLDSQTGAVAQCGWSATGWACHAVPDERAALDNEIERLRKENAGAEEVAARVRFVDLPSAAKPEVSERKIRPRSLTPPSFPSCRARPRSIAPSAS